LPDPVVVQIIGEYRKNLLEQESAQFEDMTAQWRKIERALEGQVDALAFEIDRMRAAGEDVGEWRLQRLARYQALLAQAEEELRKYLGYAEDSITRAQVQSGTAGAEQAQMVLDAMYSSAKIYSSFDLLPIEAIESMAGLTGDGSPLRDLLAQAWPEAAASMTDKLIWAITHGMNPRETARKMFDGLADGLNRLLTIARTEQLRAYREATRQQYLKSGVVTKYKRIAARQTRTCLACLLADGKEYDLETSFQDHPNGRCALVPIVANLPEIKWQSGKDWFGNLSEAQQRGMMGGAKFEAWQRGQIQLSDLVKTHRNETWGDSLAVKSDKELKL
jgi:hypothetical protein